ncbi:MAG: hypothetical protein LBC40_01735 [Dysgonamonadaceae bacterium]|nr:hypothetical protein [Dysgonamonadaceae bacterium]
MPAHKQKPLALNKERNSTDNASAVFLFSRAYRQAMSMKSIITTSVIGSKDCVINAGSEITSKKINGKYFSLGISNLQKRKR